MAGNRNCALRYTLGALVVSSDDEMRPPALMEDSPEWHPKRTLKPASLATHADIHSGRTSS